MIRHIANTFMVYILKKIAALYIIMMVAIHWLKFALGIKNCKIYKQRPVKKYVSNETKVSIITESIENNKHDTKKRKKEISI